MTALYTVAEVRSIEHAATAALPPGTLMQRAGIRAAAAAMRMLQCPYEAAHVLVLAGPGNNGGDALVTASELAKAGVRVTAILIESGQRSDDVRNAHRDALATGVQIVSANAGGIPTQHYDLVVDGLFGIGLKRPVEGIARTLIDATNALERPVLALDVPSGLDADTGCIVGHQGTAVRADRTITFIGDKPGLHTCDGRDLAGEVSVSTLEIDADRFPAPTLHVNSVAAFESCLSRRRHNSHKGTYGNVVIVGGAEGMCGAPVLSAHAAAKCGAGRTFVAFLDTVPAYDSQHPELMFRAARETDLAAATLVIGPGLGTSPGAREMLAKGLHAAGPLVLDADALNLIATDGALKQLLAIRMTSAVLTPHPLEAARLLEVSTQDIQGDRIKAARAIAERYNSVVVLKGSGSIVCAPDGSATINPTGNPALATAGTGDVLAGICGALLAQGFPSWQGALAATWIHGKAADDLVAQGTGPIGMMASELVPYARSILNRLTRERSLRNGA